MTQQTKILNETWIPDIRRLRADTIDYLYSEWREDDTETGWPHAPNYDRVTSWGGTMEAIRALVQIGESPYEPKIAQGIEWLKSEQRPDGGWDIWEADQSLVESTSWGIITLRLAGVSLDSSVIQDATDFLTDCAQSQSSGYAWGTAADHQCRIYATLAATLALRGFREEYAVGGAEWLLTVANIDGGWGYRDDRDSNIAMTAMVLYTLRRIGVVDIKDSQTQEAKEFILNRQLPDGTWENKPERWSAEGDGQITMEHGTLPWAVLALLETDINLTNDQLVAGVQAVSNQQLPSGAFQYEEGDSEEPIWYTANCILSLNKYANRLSSPEGMQNIIDVAVADQFGDVKNTADEIEAQLSSLQSSVMDIQNEANENSEDLQKHLPRVYIGLGIAVFVGLDLHQAALSFASSNQTNLTITFIGAIISFGLTILYERGYVS